MLQEIAVPDAFTIGETLSFHGRLVGMSREVIQAGVQRLLALLHLPAENTLVRKLR